MSDEALVAEVRRFNRTVTQRIGALDEHFMSRHLALGEARLLWEIGPEGTEIRMLRARLGLDSGYLSRLLRKLEASGFVTTAPSPEDARVRMVAPTAKGRRERATLDRRSDEQVEAILAPL